MLLSLWEFILSGAKDTDKFFKLVKIETNFHFDKFKYLCKLYY